MLDKDMKASRFDATASAYKRAVAFSKWTDMFIIPLYLTRMFIKALFKALVKS